MAHSKTHLELLATARRHGILFGNPVVALEYRNARNWVHIPRMPGHDPAASVRAVTAAIAFLADQPSVETLTLPIEIDTLRGAAVAETIRRTLTEHRILGDRLVLTYESAALLSPQCDVHEAIARVTTRGFEVGVDGVGITQAVQYSRLAVFDVVILDEDGSAAALDPEMQEVKTLASCVASATKPRVAAISGGDALVLDALAHNGLPYTVNRAQTRVIARAEQIRDAEPEVIDFVEHQLRANAP